VEAAGIRHRYPPAAAATERQGGAESPHRSRGILEPAAIHRL
jgi:hypothetical protein